MDINITLFGEMLTFAVLVWVTVKYIWPPITKAMEERQQKIADGLDAAQRGQYALELAHKNIAEQLHEAKAKSNVILDQANQHANNLIEESRIKAKSECAVILAKAKLDIGQEVKRAKQELQQQTAALVIAATEKLLQQKIDEAAQQRLINQLITEI